MRFFVALATLALIAACGVGPERTEASKPEENLASAPQSSSPASSPAATDPDNGRRQFRLCQSCHKISPDGEALVGPNLYAMFGRRAGSMPGFRYSDALAEAGFDWTPEKLDAWLADPRGYLPGNAMSFAGIRDPQDRADLIAFLQQATAPQD